jgi:hypothetical protein
VDRAQTVRALLEEASRERYSSEPIPNDVDGSVSDFLEAYLSASPPDRADVSSSIGSDSVSAEMLTVYSGRMAALAVRTAGIRWLKVGIAAMVLAAPGADHQEFDWTLPILHDAATRMGVDPQTVFAEITATTAAGKRVMRIFQWNPEERLLKHDRALMGPDGFRYEPVLESNSS